MTARETERLAKVEEGQKANGEKLDYLIERFDKFVDSSEKRFVSRSELKISQWVVGFVISIVTFALMVKDHLR